MKYFTLLLSFLVLGLSTNTLAQSGLVATIRNQTVIGSNFQFDLYIRANNAQPIFLANADFVLTFNATSFTNPVLTKVGTAPGSNTFVPTDQTGVNLLLTRNNYFNNTSITTITGNELIINLNGPTPSDQTAFNSSVARIDNTIDVHRLGTFQISGYHGGDNGVQWKTIGSGIITQVFEMANTGNFNSSIVTLTVANGISTFQDLPNTTLNQDAILVACDSIKSKMIIQNSATTTDVEYKAGVSITLLPGFHAMKGVNFTAKIENNCRTNSLQSTEVEVVARQNSSSSESFSSPLNQSINPIELKVFPNPFIGTTNIQLELPSEVDVQMYLYNLQGQLLKKVLPLTRLPEGAHHLSMQANSLPAGIYLLILKTPKEVISRKLMITQ